jgi:hypothetical protein
VKGSRRGRRVGGGGDRNIMKSDVCVNVVKAILWKMEGKNVDEIETRIYDVELENKNGIEKE